MKKIAKYLKKAMTLAEAYQVLNVSPSATPEEIKKKYRELSLKHHPDLGGSHEQMVKINQAKAVLDNPNQQSRQDDYQQGKRDYDQRAKEREQQRKKNTEGNSKLTKKIKDEMSSKQAQYLEHIKKYTGLTARMFFKEVVNQNGFSLDYKFKLEDGSELTLHISSYAYSTSVLEFLGYSNVYSFKDKKTSKMQKSRYDRFTFEDLKNPEKFFPAKRLKTIFKQKSSPTETSKTTKLKKQDYINILIKEFFAKYQTTPDQYLVPLPNDLFVGIYRFTFMKVGAWGISGLFEKTKYGVNRKGETPKHLSYFETFDPTVENNFNDLMDFLKKAKENKIDWKMK